ncbi:MAG: hypothetical protein AB8G16_15045 [Gammaproteobacteria bacterium]
MSFGLSDISSSKFFVIAFAAAASVCVSVGAEEDGHASVSPASFTDDARSLQNRVRMGGGGKDVSAVLRCTSVVDAEGGIGSNVCYSHDKKARRYARQIERALEKVQLRPARLRARAMPTMMHYSVAFERQDGDERVRAWQHHGFNTDTEDGSFIAPQPMLIGAIQPGNLTCGPGEYFLRMRVEINGRVSQIVASDSAPESCDDDRLLEMADLWFVPAYSDGERVAADYLYYHFARPRNRPSNREPTQLSSRIGEAPVRLKTGRVVAARVPTDVFLVDAPPTFNAWEPTE